MSDDMEDLPTNHVYEDGVDLQESIFDDLRTTASVMQNINWDQTIRSSERAGIATQSAATQFHYSNMSHLILCGQVMKHETKRTDVSAQQLAVYLANFKLQGVDAWGRYLGKTGSAEDVSRELKQYFRKLFSEGKVLPLFIGMETLGGATAHAAYTQIQDVGDPLFQDIIDTLLDHKEDELDIAAEYLETEITALSEEDRQALATTAEEYRSIAESILTAHSADFAAVNIDLRDTLQAINTTINEFHRDIGLSDR